MPFANINGIEMHYHEEGEGNPVVLINGFSGDTNSPGTPTSSNR